MQLQLTGQRSSPITVHKGLVLCSTVDAEIFKGILFSRLGLTSKFKSSNY